ncbi:MAG: DUF4097 family beta strand repeat-containing protein [Eubacteriales bacterium]
MTELQKVIKYLALALAVFLSVTIIGGLLSALAGLSLIFSDGESDVVGEMQTYAVEGEISSLEVDLSGAALQIKTAESFAVESNHKYVTVKSDNGRLRIRETKRPFASSPEGVKVTVCIPEGFVFDDVSIDTGAGTVDIEALAADVLELSLGAGRADIRNLTANTRADIDGGAGELTIDGGKLCKLNLEMGVGKLTLKSRLEGKCSLDYGVGETKLILLGSREDYKIRIDKGIGDATLAGEHMNDDSTYGSGSNFIDIDGGIGAIRIDFAEN